ncbi:endonuclease/exonuclease/phosphatase family protein [Flavihumibacter sp. ZG627]|uniref:endonuclease/exonuclease/phosphatase family protein n=1 Tax=Flavihumibacter sp. ZG627 TaxID=1463156 RepID=UPI00057FBDAA|nr:endonuclease/exonuclease/phosphatase family protein [Flavihumibacter sp. ZG627]KIC90102.1 endonuclease [Flavihumibacter sp. ZG627]
MISKKLAITSCLLCALLPVFGQSIIAGSFNLRYDNPRDTGNLWQQRAPIAAALIRFHQFDIVGTQEGLRHQLDDLQNALPQYAQYGIGRDDGKRKGEHSSILYRKDKFLVKDSGSFWLSDNPDGPGFGWDAKHNRICSWLKLETIKGRKSFYVFNVHYDHQGVIARQQSSKLALEKISSIAGRSPVIFTGDFNGNHQSEWYLSLKESTLLEDALNHAPDPYLNNGSFNSFKDNNPSKDIIDHIFITSHFKVKRFGILTDTYHGKYPSDHYPILAELVF